MIFSLRKVSAALPALMVAFSAVFAALSFSLACGQVAYAADNQVNPYQRPDSSFIYDTLMSDIASADSYFDGQTVQVTGEVVGDSIRELSDPGRRWITLQATDGSYAQVAVCMSVESASLIDTFGVYGKKGTTLQVRGTFNLACDEHEGLSDLHADSVVVVEKGSVIEQEFNLKSFIPGAMFVIVGLILVAVFYRVRERQR